MNKQSAPTLGLHALYLMSTDGKTCHSNARSRRLVGTAGKVSRRRPRPASSCARRSTEFEAASTARGRPVRRLPSVSQRRDAPESNCLRRNAGASRNRPARALSTLTTPARANVSHVGGRASPGLSPEPLSGKSVVAHRMRPYRGKPARHRRVEPPRSDRRPGGKQRVPRDLPAALSLQKKRPRPEGDVLVVDCALRALRNRGCRRALDRFLHGSRLNMDHA
jgi:hypothetical protein